MKKTLILFRLFDRTYGPQGNPKTLSVYLNPDNTLGYSFYGVRSFNNVERLRDKIKSCLATGCGSNDIKEVEILNDL